MRYIGGKSLLTDKICGVINSEIPRVSSAIDIFAGSGAVSQSFKKAGYRTVSNDFLYFSYVMSYAAVVLNKRPCFRNLGIADPIKYLNALKPEDTDLNPRNVLSTTITAPSGTARECIFSPTMRLKST